MSFVAKIATAFTCGVALGALLPIPPAFGVAAATASAAVLALSAVTRRAVFSAPLVCALVAGWCRAPFPDASGLEARELEPCTRVVSGTVATSPVVDGDAVRLALRADSMTRCSDRPTAPVLEPFSADVFLTAPALPEGLREGDRVLARARVKTAARAANFGDARPPPAPVARLSARAESSGDVIRLGPARRLPSPIEATRERLSAFFRANMEPPVDGLARALVLGESAALDPALKDRFRRAGTAHLLAVSGLHLGILAWASYGLLRRALLRLGPLARRRDVGRVAAALAIPILISYAQLVGGRAPVARACVMASSVLAARAFGRRAGAAESVALAAAGLLAFDPTDISDPGFQLSFAAILSFLVGARTRRAPSDRICGVAPPAGALERAAKRIADASIRLFFGSLAATAATTPIALYHFDQISAVAVPCNMAAVPLTSAVVMPILFGVASLALVSPPLAALFAPLAGALLRALDEAVRVASEPSFAAVDHPGGLLAATAVASCLAGLSFAAHRRPASAAVFAGALIFTVFAAAAEAPHVPDGRFSLHVLDVGQGSAALVTFPDGRSWLVDAGGSDAGPEAFGERRLVPALRRLGVRALETLVLSHADPDHVVGAAAAIRSFGPRTLWVSGFGEEENGREASSPYLAALGEARRAGALVRSAPGICGRSEVGGVTVEVLHPCLGATGFDPALSANDNSLVVRFVYGETSFLLPGDLSREGETRLVEGGTHLASDILLLGHHGSDSSTTDPFLAATHPSIAIASCGRFNRYGFPKRSVASSLARLGIDLWRTDRDGAVRAVSDGSRLVVTAARSE